MTDYDPITNDEERGAQIQKDVEKYQASKSGAVLDDCIRDVACPAEFHLYDCATWVALDRMARLQNAGVPPTPELHSWIPDSSCFGYNEHQFVIQPDPIDGFTVEMCGLCLGVRPTTWEDGDYVVIEPVALTRSLEAGESPPVRLRTKKGPKGHPVKLEGEPH